MGQPTQEPPTTVGACDCAPIVDITRTATPLPDSLRATVSSAVLALRWGAAGYGITVAASLGSGERTWSGVMALALCVFITTLRTFAPLELGARGSSHMFAITDVVAVSVAAGWTGGTGSPWIFCTMAAVAIASYGWGWPTAAFASTLAVIGVIAGTAMSGTALDPLFDSQQDLAIIATMLVASITGVFIRRKLIEAEQERQAVMGEMANLEHANELLRELSGVALTLPGAFSLREALDRTRRMLGDLFDPEVALLITIDEHNDEWTPKLTDGYAMSASYELPQLPEPLRTAIETDAVVFRKEFEGGVAPDSKSGVYMPLHARGRLIGVLGVEHSQPGHFDHIEGSLRDGLADVVALTVDNSRWFGRLRSLGAEDERIRVARDIHDRLGQWMTYIKMELERLSTKESVDPQDLERLHLDAERALEELRDTLRQLRTGVSDDRPLSILAEDLVERFSDRTQVRAQFEEAHPGERMPVPVENELLRILQEALNNVDRHAKAEHVDVTWDVDGGTYELVVSDDGVGFDATRAVRDQAFGVIGMRERANVIGAVFKIDSSPGQGTQVRVRAGQNTP